MKIALIWRNNGKIKRCVDISTTRNTVNNYLMAHAARDSVLNAKINCQKSITLILSALILIVNKQNYYFSKD